MHSSRRGESGQRGRWNAQTGQVLGLGRAETPRPRALEVYRQVSTLPSKTANASELARGAYNDSSIGKAPNEASIGTHPTKFRNGRSPVLLKRETELGPRSAERLATERAYCRRVLIQKAAELDSHSQAETEAARKRCKLLSVQLSQQKSEMKE